MKLKVLIAIAALTLPGCTGGDTLGCDFSTDVSRLESPIMDAPVEFTDSYFTHDPSYHSSRIIFTNYPSEEDSDFKELEEGQHKLTIGLLSTEMATGEYKLSLADGIVLDNSLSVTLQSGAQFASLSSLNYEETGVAQIDVHTENSVCGQISVADSQGFALNASFNLQ